QRQGERGKEQAGCAEDQGVFEPEKRGSEHLRRHRKAACAASPEVAEREHAECGLCGRSNEPGTPDPGERRKQPDRQGAEKGKEDLGEKDSFGKPPVYAEAEVERSGHDDDSPGQQAPKLGKGGERGKQGNELVDQGKAPVGEKYDQKQVGKNSHRLISRVNSVVASDCMGAGRATCKLKPALRGQRGSG